MSAGVSYAGMAFNFEIMKNLFCLCILLLIGSMQMSRASDKIEKQPLKVLYVGGSADIQVLNETISDSTALRKSIADRTAAFGEMLRQYFQTKRIVRTRPSASSFQARSPNVKRRIHKTR